MKARAVAKRSKRAQAERKPKCRAVST
jgi:hypothetical protein